jgi:hypothetical protein
MGRLLVMQDFFLEENIDSLEILEKKKNSKQAI